MVAEYAEFLFYVWDDEREEVVGVGHAIPAAWDGDRTSLPDGGFDAVLEALFAEGAPAHRPLRAGNHDPLPVSRPRPQSRISSGWRRSAAEMKGVYVEPNVWMVHPPLPAGKPRLLAWASKYGITHIMGAPLG